MYFVIFIWTQHSFIWSISYGIPQLDLWPRSWVNVLQWGEETIFRLQLISKRYCFVWRPTCLDNFISIKAGVRTSQTSFLRTISAEKKEKTKSLTGFSLSVSHVLIDLHFFHNNHRDKDPVCDSSDLKMSVTDHPNPKKEYKKAQTYTQGSHWIRETCKTMRLILKFQLFIKKKY